MTGGNIIPPKAQMVMARDFVVRRSELTVPGHSMKMMEKAAASNADQVMFDLEDATAVSQKVEARKTVIEAFNTLDFKGKIRAFRPNNIRTRIRTQYRHFKLCSLSVRRATHALETV
jgi:citrate lyase beta subunit